MSQVGGSGTQPARLRPVEKQAPVPHECAREFSITRVLENSPRIMDESENGRVFSGAGNGENGDMMTMGILDPTEVTRTVLDTPRPDSPH